MAMRNFWCVAKVDGREGAVTFGPLAKDGGFDLTVYQREDGESVEVAEVLGREKDGVLTLTVRAERIVTEQSAGKIVIRTRR